MLEVGYVELDYGDAIKAEQKLKDIYYRFCDKQSERFKQHLKCRTCDTTVHPLYLYIIKELKKAQLLSKRYKPICCSCQYRKDLRTSNNAQKHSKNAQI